jgi:hypothetical protein
MRILLITAAIMFVVNIVLLTIINVACDGGAFIAALPGMIVISLISTLLYIGACVLGYRT